MALALPAGIFRSDVSFDIKTGGYEFELFRYVCGDIVFKKVIIFVNDTFSFMGIYHQVNTYINVILRIMI